MSVECHCEIERSIHDFREHLVKHFFGHGTSLVLFQANSIFGGSEKDYVLKITPAPLFVASFAVAEAS